jgi:hypothetical protein
MTLEKYYGTMELENYYGTTELDLETSSGALCVYVSGGGGVFLCLAHHMTTEARTLISL